MAYNPILWQDEADQYEDIFIEEPSSVAPGAVKHTKYRGNVAQEGTSQNAANFGKMDFGIFDAHTAVQILLMLARQNSWEVEVGSVSLTNTYTYPFNNSKKSVALAHTKEDSNYVVLTEVTSFSGNVGEIVVSDKLTNGFKVEHTGSASAVTVKYIVIGGILK